MNILIAFATNSGGTQDAVRIVGEALTAGNHQVTTKMIRDTSPEELTNFDVVIFGSPSWDTATEEGMPHEDFLIFMDKVKGKTFPDKKFAIVGLGDSSYAKFCGAVDHLETLVGNLQGKLVIPSLRIDGYYTKSGNQDKVKSWTGQLIGTIK